MTNPFALGLGLVLAALIALNFVLGLEAHVFLGRKLLDLIWLLAFWR
jgi:hypothetical protein